MLCKPCQHSITLISKKMNEADFKKYADQELVKCQRRKLIWQRATNPTIKSKAFFTRCI